MTKYQICLLNEVRSWDWESWKEELETSSFYPHNIINIGWIFDLIPACGKSKVSKKDAQLFVTTIDAVANTYGLYVDSTERDEIWLKIVEE